jgi:hypothetical protein
LLSAESVDLSEWARSTQVLAQTAICELPRQRAAPAKKNTSLLLHAHLWPATKTVAQMAMMGIGLSHGTGLASSAIL